MKNSIALLALFFVTFSLLNGCKKKDDDECPICPSVVSIFPTSGSGGDTLTITGINFAESAADNIVKINSVLIAPESIISGTTTEIKVIVPENCGTGPVTVDFDSELTNQGTPPIFQYNTSYSVGTKQNLNLPYGIAFSDNTATDFMYVVSENKIYLLTLDGQIANDNYFTAQTGQTIKDIAIKGTQVYAIISTSTNDIIYKLNGNTQPTLIGTFPSFSLKGIALDNNGDIYVSSTDNTIKKMLKTTPYTLSTYASSGIVGPYGLAFASNNILYVSEATNNRILKISTNGTVSVLAGASGSSGSNDGTGANASFNSPRGIACDNSNNVYVAEYTGRVIRKIDANAKVTTLAGNSSLSGSNNGIGDAATFQAPYGISVDATGNVWVTDVTNNMVRYIYPQ
jgi:sugar lactone lactonase YvrE